MSPSRRFNPFRADGRQRESGLAVPRAPLIAALCALLCFAALTRAATPTELIEQYLGDRGLTKLLAVHLESELTRAGGTERVQIAERLAAVYARLIERAETAADREELEAKSRELLTRIPEADSLELRLSLAQSAYLPLEQAAERWRLRLISKEEAASTAAGFRQLEHTFSQIASKADEVIRALERQEESSRPTDTDLLSAALSRGRRHRSLAHYFAGWSNLYIAELNEADRQSASHEAARHFGWLLNAQTGKAPDFGRLPEETLQYDHVARAAIGTAMAAAIRGSLADALQWIEGLEQSASFAESVRPALRRARLLALAWNERWTQIATLVVQAQSAPVDKTGSDSLASRRVIVLDGPTARQLAVLALEAKPHPADQSAVLLVTGAALSHLIRENELANIADLAERYERQLEILPQWQQDAARGVSMLERASALDAEAGAKAPHVESRARLADAAENLGRALNARTPTDDEVVMATLKALRAYALYRIAGSPEQFANAATLLAEASRGLNEVDPTRAAESLWLAVRAGEDAASRVTSDAAITNLRDSLVEEFIQTFPLDDRAGLLLVEKARKSNASSEELVASLLEVPQDSALFIVARMHAADLLYDRYLAAESTRREWSARRYLEVAEPLLQLNRRAAFEGDAKAAQWVSAHGRRVSRVLLSLPNPNLDQAELVLDSIDALQGIGLAMDEATRAEVLYRRAQIALARDNPAKASEAVEELSRLGGAYQHLGARLLFEDATRRFREAQRAGVEAAILSSASEVVTLGRRLLQSLTSAEGQPPQDDLPVSLYVDVSEAAMLLWEHDRSEEHRELALLLLRRLLRTYPDQPSFIRSMARLAESTGDLETALAHRRKLAAGERPGSLEWFEARYELFRVLSLVNTTRAREAVQQHVALYPEFGPEPWGAKIRELSNRLSVGAGP